MTAKKRQHNVWQHELVAKLAHIRWCEACGTTSQSPPLQHAHRLKRDFISWKNEADHQEYLTAAKLCQTCHERIEFSGHDNMKAAVTELIERRNKSGVVTDFDFGA